MVNQEDAIEFLERRLTELNSEVPRQLQLLTVQQTQLLRTLDEISSLSTTLAFLRGEGERRRLAPLDRIRERLRELQQELFEASRMFERGVTHDRGRAIEVPTQRRFQPLEESNAARMRRAAVERMTTAARIANLAAASAAEGPSQEETRTGQVDVVEEARKMALESGAVRVRLLAERLNAQGLYANAKSAYGSIFAQLDRHPGFVRSARRGEFILSNESETAEEGEVPKAENHGLDRAKMLDPLRETDTE